MSDEPQERLVANTDSTIDACAQEVVDLSRWLHANPELGFQEFQAAEKTTALLERHGFTVEREAGGLDTAFVATAGQGSFVVALCVEYDALPEVGHACGHNLIAGASVAAALGLYPLVDELDITLRVIGTPAEETGGGKQLLIDAGAFDGVNIAMMIHAMPEGLSYSPRGLSMQVIGGYRATFTGKSSHAAQAPELGRNAGSAAVLTQVAVGLLRQHIPDGQRLAVVVDNGGDSSNVIPETAVISYECRANTTDEFEVLRERVEDCVRAGALGTGCEVEIEQVGPIYRELVQNETLSEIWDDAIGRFGYDVTPTPGLAGGSTDMGNVSVTIPSIHPFVGLPGVTAPIHSREFEAAANTESAYRVMIHAAKALAATAAGAATASRQQLNCVPD
jgi:amidohydrolase